MPINVSFQYELLMYKSKCMVTIIEISKANLSNSQRYLHCPLKGSRYTKKIKLSSKVENRLPEFLNFTFTFNSIHIQFTSLFDVPTIHSEFPGVTYLPLFIQHLYLLSVAGRVIQTDRLHYNDKSLTYRCHKSDTQDRIKYKVEHIFQSYGIINIMLISHLFASKRAA